MPNCPTVQQSPRVHSLLQLLAQGVVLSREAVAVALAVAAQLRSEARQLPLQRRHLPRRLLVLLGAVADELGPLGKLERAQGLPGVDGGGADIGDDHRLGVTAERVLQGGGQELSGQHSRGKGGNPRGWWVGQANTTVAGQLPQRG